MFLFVPCPGCGPFFSVPTRSFLVVPRLAAVPRACPLPLQISVSAEPADSLGVVGLHSCDRSLALRSPVRILRSSPPPPGVFGPRACVLRPYCGHASLLPPGRRSAASAYFPGGGAGVDHRARPVALLRFPAFSLGASHQGLFPAGSNSTIVLPSVEETVTATSG